LGGGQSYVGLRGQPQALAQLRLHAVEELVHARGQSLVLQHQGVTHHHTGHARVLLAELQHHGGDLAGLHRARGLALDDLVDQGEHRGLDEFDQALEHLGLAGEVPVQRCLAHLQPGRQRSGGDALSTRLLQHASQGLKDLDAPLAGLGPLARGRRGARGIGLGAGFSVGHVGHG
jgi:hypothetical protein